MRYYVDIVDWLRKAARGIRALIFKISYSRELSQQYSTASVIEGYTTGKRDFSKAVIIGQSFDGIDLSGIDFSNSDIQGASFRNANLREAKFCQARIGIAGYRKLIKLAIGLVLTVFIFALSGHAAYFFETTALLDFGKWEPLPRFGYQCKLDPLKAKTTSCAEWHCVYQSNNGHLYSVPAARICRPTAESRWIISFAIIFFHTILIMIFIRSGYERSLNIVLLILLMSSVFFAISTAWAMTMSGPGKWIQVPIGRGYLVGLLNEPGLASLFLQIWMAISISGFAAFVGTFISAISFSMTNYRILITAIIISLPWAVFMAYSKHESEESLPSAILAGSIIIINAASAVYIAQKECYSFVGRLAVMLETKLGTCFQQADISGADFSGADLEGVDFRLAKMKHTILQGTSNFHKARLDSDSPLNVSAVQQLLRSRVGIWQNYYRFSMCNLDLQGVKLNHANLRNADLSGANLCKADLSDTDLRDADLCGTCLKDAQLINAKLQGAQFDPATYALSGFDLTMLEKFLKKGVRLISENLFNDEVKCSLDENRGELILRFNTKPNEYLYWATQAMIVNVLGPDTDCRLVNFGHEQGSAVLRLRSSSRDHLERIAQIISDSIEVPAQPNIDQDALRVIDGIPRQIKQMELRPAHKKSAVWQCDLLAGETVIYQTVRVLVSYAPEDKRYFNTLSGHLKTLERNRSIELWHAGKVAPGANRDNEIAKKLDSSHLIILLISVNYINHDEIYERELKGALERRRAGVVQIIPILIGAVELMGTPLAEMQLLPRHGSPISGESSGDEDWVLITKEITTLVRNLSGRSTVIDSPL